VAVSRERLTRQLLSEPRLSTVAIIGPAGYGKTVLLADWAARETRDVVWLTSGTADQHRRGATRLALVGVELGHRLIESPAIPVPQVSRHRGSSVPAEVETNLNHLAARRADAYA
jgi:KaiC/GvpD/RAD55 family RecA-like ATPase